MLKSRRVTALIMMAILLGACLMPSAVHADEQNSAQPGKLPYTPVVTPNGSTLPWRIIDGVKEFHLIVEEIDHGVSLRGTLLTRLGLEDWAPSDSRSACTRPSGRRGSPTSGLRIPSRQRNRTACAEARRARNRPDLTVPIGTRVISAISA